MTRPEDQRRKPELPQQQRTLNRTLIVVVFLLAAIIGFLLLRPSHPGPLLPGPGHPPPPRLEQKKTIQGIVQGYKYNTHLDINALSIKTSSEGIITVDFRPHTAKAVMDAAAVNDLVEVRYSLQPNDESVGYQLHQVRNLNNGSTINADELPPPPRVPPNQSAETFFIKNPVLITDQYGGIAAIRSNHSLFHFKPGQVDDISSLIKNSHELNLLAVPRGDQSGFVNVNNDKVYIVISITINDQTFLIR